MLVFIDESGDPGFKISKGSSRTFVMALVAFNDPDVSNRCCSAIREYSKTIRGFSEFKFSKTRAEIKDQFFGTVCEFDFKVRAIVVQKERIHSGYLRSNKEAFYQFFVKSMLKFDNGLLKNANVIIDGSGERTFRNELSSYLRKHTEPGAIKKVRFSDSKRDPMVQLADMCSGAIARSYNESRKDADRWKQMLKKHIEDIWDFK